MTSSQGFSVARHAVSYARTLDHLRAWKLRLPREVTEVAITVSNSSSDRQDAGTKLFLQQNVPQLKFHNPSVKFSVESQDQPQLTFVSADGGREIVDTTDLQSQEIVQKLNSLFTSTDTVPHSHNQ